MKPGEKLLNEAGLTIHENHIADSHGFTLLEGITVVTNRRTKIFNFCFFLLPAIVLYTLFFIRPLLQGINYSLTDWNGIVPEIPFTIDQDQFENEIVPKLKSKQGRQYLKQFYVLTEDGSGYRLKNWIESNNQIRALTNSERNQIKKLLKSAGVSAIKFVGFENYRQMFRSDERFLPRFQKRYFYNEFQDLPTTISKQEFRDYLLKNLKNASEIKFVNTCYQLDSKGQTYHLKTVLTATEDTQLRQILSESYFQTTLIPGVVGFTLFFTVFNVIFSNLLALMLALALDTKIRSQNILRSVFFFPNVLSLVIVAFIWSFVFRLILPPLTGIAVWLGSPQLAPYALLMVTVWQGCGWLMVIYLAGLQTIPAHIIEVAAIDGANWWQRFVKITVPLLLPAFTVCIFFSLANSLKTFDIIMTLTQGGPGYATTPIVLDIYYNAFRDNLYGYATAKAVFLCLIIMMVTGIQLFFMKRKEVEL